MEGQLTRIRLRGVPILTYHELGKPEQGSASRREVRYRVSRSAFREQLRLIRRRQLNIVPLREICEVPSLQTTASVGLTIDDGRIGDYDSAFPLLTETALTAEFFVNTACIGRKGYLSWTQIAEMHQAGMRFQSHGHEHVYLTHLSLPDLRAQLRVPKNRLEEKLGSPVELLAVPFGEWNRRVLSEARAAGYRAICTSRNWPAQWGAQVLDRTAIFSRTSLHEFAALLDCQAGPYSLRRIRSLLLWPPKQLILRSGAWRPADAEGVAL